MPKTEIVDAVDRIQKEVRPELARRGFRVRGRTFDRAMPGGIVHVVNFQAGRSDPPGTVRIPIFRENFYGLFTLNLGVYVPSVAKVLGYQSRGSWVQEYDCQIRSRIGRLVRDGKDLWWKAAPKPEIVSDVLRCITEAGLPFLERFKTEAEILSNLREHDSTGGGNPTRLILAIIQGHQANSSEARRLLSDQIREVGRPAHQEYVNKIAEKLGLGALDG